MTNPPRIDRFAAPSCVGGAARPRRPRPAVGPPSDRGRRSPAGRVAGASRAASARALALVGLLLATAPLEGCSVRMFGRRIGFPARSAEPRPEKIPSARRLPETIAEVREEATLDPAQPYWPFRLAELQVASDSSDAAVASLETALRRDRGYAPALALLSRLDFAAGRHEQAVARLERARADGAAFPGGFPSALVEGLALHYDALGRIDEAREALRGLAPGHRGSAAVYLTLRGDTPDSADGAARADVREHPKSAVSHNNYGITRLRAGDPEGARKAFERAIDLDPALPGPYYNLAILEKYFAFDDAAAARWFGLYRQRSSDDPDGLAEALKDAATKDLAEQRGAK